MTYRIAPLIAALALSLGCDLPGGDVGCTEIAVASVVLEIVDRDTGEPVDATVRYTLDDGEVLEPDSMDDPADPIVLAYEQTGTFEVTVMADGYADAVETYEVGLDEDGCHPVGVSDTIELQAE